MNNIEDYQNLVALLEQALKFYANENNYMPTTLNASLFAEVHLDHGSQARFALSKIKEINDLNDKIQDDYKKIVEETQLLESDGETNPINLIEHFIQTRNGENNNI
jgi:hypothetical protein